MARLRFVFESRSSFFLRKPPLAFAAHSFFAFPPRKKSEWRGAARREGGTRGTPRVAGFSIVTQSGRTWRVQVTTHAERAKWVRAECRIRSPKDGKGCNTKMVHTLPADLRKVIAGAPAAKAVWDDITPLARNEWICWVISGKKAETRNIRIKKALSKMKGGMRRPCCWASCPHR